MHRAIISKQTAKGRGQTDHGGQTDSGPAPIVRKGKKNVARISSRTQNPQRYNDGEKACHVDDKDNALNQR